MGHGLDPDLAFEAATVYMIFAVVFNIAIGGRRLLTGHLPTINFRRPAVKVSGRADSVSSLNSLRYRTL